MLSPTLVLVCTELSQIREKVPHWPPNRAVLWAAAITLCEYGELASPSRSLTQVVAGEGDRRPGVHADARVVDDPRRLVVHRDDAHGHRGGHARLGLGARHQGEAVAGRVAAVVDVLRREEEEGIDIAGRLSAGFSTTATGRWTALRSVY